MTESEQIEKLLKLNYTNAQIAEVINCHSRSVSKKIKRYGLKRDEINTCVICGKILTNSRRHRCDTCNTKIRRYRAKLKGVEYLGSKCKNCGFIGNLSCYDFHHKNPNEKDFTPSAKELANKSWEVVKKELDKCELLCANCHRLEHNDYENEIFLKIATQGNTDMIFKK